MQKLTNATQLSLTERALLQGNVRFLSEINNEAKVRRATKSKVTGTARVMSFEDVESARAGRAAKEATKKAASETRTLDVHTIATSYSVREHLRCEVCRAGLFRLKERLSYRAGL